MPLTKERYRGKVLNWSYHGHGFIYDFKLRKRVFAHFTAINERGFKSLMRDQVVSYKLTYNNDKNSWVAKNIKYETKR